MKENDTDTLIYILAGMIFVPPLLAKFVPGVRDALVNWHILVTDNVLIPFHNGIGLDLPRVLIVLCAVGAIVSLIVLLLRARAARKKKAEK